MGIYSAIAIIIFGLFTILEIYSFFKREKKDRATLVQTLGTYWTLWFAIFSIEQSRNDVIDSRKQLEYSQKQFEVQIEPILKVRHLVYKKDILVLDSFAIELSNDGTNDIYDLRINQEEYFCQPGEMNLLGGSGSRIKGFDYEFPILESGKKKLLMLTKDKMEKLKVDRTNQINLRDLRKNNVFLILVYQLYFTRSVDKKNYHINKYFGVFYRANGDEIVNIEDIKSDNIMYKECIDKIIEFHTIF